MIINRLRPLVVPIIILVVMVVTFALLIPDLGYYLDDWPNVYFDKIGGNEATLLFHASDGRPIKGWYPILLFDLFGYSPLPWQIFNLGLRYLTVLFSWLIFRALWPKSEKPVAAAALLFAVYPVFAQQPIAITFIPQWTSFLCVFVSTYLMILGIQKPRWALAFTLPALIISAVGLVISDYFIALEFIRPFIIWMLIWNQKNTLRDRAIATGLRFLPYLAVVASYVVWRWFFAVLPVADRLEVSLLTKIAASPIRETIHLGLVVLQDLIAIVVSAWYKTFEPGILRLDSPIEMAALALTAFVSVFTYFAVWKLTNGVEESGSQTNKEVRQRLFIGILMVVLGAAPGWLIGRQVSDTSGIWNDRFGMASMAGAGLVVVSIAELMFTTPKWRQVFLAILVGLAAGWQVRNLNDYRWSWTYQQRFYNQLLWRIPALKPDTLFLAEREFFPKVGVYPTAFTINTLYPPSRDTGQVDYWFLTIPKYFGNDMESFLEGAPVNAGHWLAWFSGFTHDAIVVDYRYDESQCLWVLGPEDELNPMITDTTRNSLIISDLTRITKEPAIGYPQWDVIGPELPKSWCYYYQKADLAQQFEDWPAIQQLWEESTPYQDSLNTGVELEPFIDGFIHLGDIQLATELTQRAKVYMYSMRPYLCSVWENGLSGQELDNSQKALANSVSADLGCTWSK